MAPKKNYTPEQMGRALDAVRKGEKIATAAKRFGVPRITLYNKVSGKSPAECSMGPQTVLTADEEQILVKWLVGMSQRHFPVNRVLLTESVQRIITEQGKENPFTDNKPGKKWFSSFLRRHPDITEKTAQNLSKSRDDVTEEDIRKWFTEINTYLHENDLREILNDPSRIFNTDESAFFLSPKAGRVLCKQGEKHIYQFCGDEKDNLTVLITANAAGQLAPPMIVFKYERVPAHISATVPDHWGIGKSESGWMCGSTFYEFMTNIFNPWLVQQEIQKPVIFFLDGHKSHLTLHVSNFCSSNGIELIALYPNSTHLLQPMDLAVFRPLKVAWKKEVSKWQLDHLGQVLKKEHFAPVLNNAIYSLSKECIQNGFRAGGMYPFGPDYIDMTKIKKQQVNKEVDPKQIEFVKYLEDEILKIYSKQKLEMFNTLYLKDRKIVEQTIPNEDESLFVIWAKNKQETFGSKISISQPSTSAISDSEISNTQRQEIEYTTAPDLTENRGQQSKKNTAISITEDFQLQQSESQQICFTGSEEDCRQTELIDRCTPTSQVTFLATQTSVHEVDHTLELNYATKRSTLPNPIEQTTDNHVSDIIAKDVPSETISTEILSPAPSGSQQVPEFSTGNNNSSSTLPAETPQKHPLEAALGVVVPSPFKKSLFWPEEPQTKKRRKKEKIPFAITSKAWQEYHKKKELEKQKLQIEKEKRAKERQDKKHLKEMNMAKKKPHSKYKIKIYNQEDSSSDDTDTDLIYAESDDSIRNEDQNESTVAKEESQNERGTESGSKRPRKKQKLDKSFSDSDDEPLCMIRVSSKTTPLARKGQFVIVKYEGEYFPGRTEDVSSNQYEVSTMVLSTGNTFRWPERQDKIWYKAEDVVQVINPPLPLNNRGFYKVKEMDEYLPNVYNI